MMHAAISRQAVTGLSAFGAAAIFAKLAEARPAPQAVKLPEGIKSYQGSWLAELTSPDGRTTRGLTTFTLNGGLIDNNAADPQQRALQSVGHGKWTQNGRQIEFMIVKFIFDAKGHMTGVKEAFTVGELDETGNHFSGATTVETYDLDGNWIETRTGTMKSRRLTIDNTPSV